MALVIGGYLQYTDIKNSCKTLLLWNLKKKKLVMVRSKIHVSDPWPSWSSCSHVLMTCGFLHKSHTDSGFSLWKHCGKRRKCWKSTFSPFSHNDSSNKERLHYLSHMKLLSANAFNLDKAKIETSWKVLKNWKIERKQKRYLALWLL